MLINNFVSTLSRDYPNGRFVHPIAEKGYTIIARVNKFLENKKEFNLWIANEYLLSLNKILNSNYKLSDIDELNNYDIVKEIENFK